MIDKSRLIRLLEPPIEALGYELVDLDLRIGSNGLLRVYIDKDNGVTVDDCGIVSHQVGTFLDVEDPIPGTYVLEVSSPGIDRRLRKPQHFRDVLNEEVRVQLARPQDGRRRFRGQLSAVDDETIVVNVDGTAWKLPYENIAAASLVSQV